MPRPENLERVYKVMFVKQKSGSYTPRLTLPYTLLKDYGIKPGDRVQIIPKEGRFEVRKYDD